MAQACAYLRHLYRYDIGGFGEFGEATGSILQAPRNIWPEKV